MLLVSSLPLISVHLLLEVRLRDADVCLPAPEPVLADTQILYALYKKHHWLMRGATFSQLHLLLDKHADEQLALVDKIAERVQTLGGSRSATHGMSRNSRQYHGPQTGARRCLQCSPALCAQMILSDAHDAAGRAPRSVTTARTT